MKLFGIPNKKKSGEGKTLSVSLPEVASAKAEAEVKDMALSQEKTNVNEEAKKPLTVSYATGWPIDVIYGYLNKNYEEKGFNDSMENSNLAFRDLNKEIIKNKILMVFREVGLNYDVMRQNLQSKAEICSAAGLMIDVANVERTIALIDSHKEELRLLEQDFRNNANEASIPLKSYECGFLRGISTIAMSGVNDRTAKVTMAPTMSTKQAIA